MDSVRPALDAVADDVGFALLVELLGREQGRELVHVRLFDGEATATAAQQEPFGLTEDLEAVTVRVATVVGLRRRLQHRLATELKVALRAYELLLLIVVDSLVELSHEPLIL